MPDVFDKAKRSEVMSRIRSSGTKAERAMQRLVRAAVGPRRRLLLNARKLPGKPDIVIQAWKVAVFVDGCFYHLCPEHGRIPASNRDYWEPKLIRNVERDISNRAELRSMGYTVWRFWEHDLRASSISNTRAVIERKILKVKQKRSGNAEKVQP